MDPISHLLGLLLFVFCIAEADKTSQVIVNTDVGPLKGFKVLAGKSEIAVFRGIPYAQSPILNNRFMPPVPISSWKEVFDASEYGPICIQTPTQNNTNSFIGQEDCLTLNIFKPMLFEKEDKNIPVIIILHTGNFISGSGRDINGVQLAKTLEAIIVTLNYRLGILGFYSMRGHIKDNLGVRDQITAMQWVQDNIKALSGNSNNILLVADHIMTSLHLTSPISRKLFNRAISFEGESYLNPIKTHTFDINEHRSKLEGFCGDLKGTTDIPVEHFVWMCLRKLQIRDVYSLSFELSSNKLWHPFRPVYDNEVINSDSHTATSFLHCDYMAFKSDLQIPSLADIADNRTKCRDIFHSVISYIAKDRFKENMRVIETILESHYFPQFFNQSYNFCKSVRNLLEDAITSDIISFANHHSRTGLTFLNFVHLLNATTKALEDGVETQSNDISCILTNQKTGSCYLNKTVTEGINNIVRTFLYHGFPTVNSNVIWRPYTTTSKNYLQTTQTHFQTGDNSNWPVEGASLLWLKSLPEISNSGSSSNEPVVSVLEQSVGLSWGLTETQLEALIFSLILSCLVLLCVTLTLFRIVCFVNGKTFYKKKKPPKKDIVLTDTKKRRDNANIFAFDIFQTRESLELSRRSGDHSNNEG